MAGDDVTRECCFVLYFWDGLPTDLIYPFTILIQNCDVCISFRGVE